jgi:hypothetical protein
MNQRKGCLTNKTQRQKNIFFKSLWGFGVIDSQFFKDQYNDLLDSEKQEFKQWVIKKHPKTWIIIEKTL